MNEYISKLEEAYETYKSNINKVKNSSDISKITLIINSIIKNKTYSSKNFLEVIEPYFEYIRNDEDKNTIKYLSKLFTFNAEHPEMPMTLDDSQLNIFRGLLLDLNNTKDQSKSFKDYQYLEKIISDLKSGNYFTDIDGLRRSFEDLSIGLDLQKEVLFTVITNNLEKANTIGQVEVEVKPVEKEVTTEKPRRGVETTETKKSKLSADEQSVLIETPNQVASENKEELSSISQGFDEPYQLNRILLKYGVQPALIKNRYMKLMRKYGSQIRFDAILQVFEPEQINKLLADGEGYVLTKILLQSNARIINMVKQICDNNNVDFNSVLLFHTDVFIEPNKAIEKDEALIPPGDDYRRIESNGEKFVNNCVFFAKNGLDVHNILISGPSILKSNDKIIQPVFTYMKENYDFKFTENGLSCIKTKTAIKNLDYIIEIIPDYEKFIADKMTFIYTGTWEDFCILKFFNTKENPIITFGERKFANKYIIDPKVMNPLREENKDRLTELDRHSLVLGEEKTKALDESIDTIDNLREINYEVVLKEPLIAHLENHFKVNDKLYVIHNPENNSETKVSRIKVLKVCSQILEKGLNIDKDTILYALSYNSILNDDDVYNLQHYREFTPKSRGGRQ